MAPAHVALALAVVVIWGLAFVATRLALDVFSPSQLTALRFLVAALPAAVLPRPPVAGPALIAVGLSLFTGQFLFQFFGIASGMPPGLASIVVQTQALFTILFAAIALGERPTGRQWAGGALAAAGLAAIATTVGSDLTRVGLGLTAASAVSWAIGNVLLKRLPPADPFSLMAWLSLVPPLPALLLAAAVDGPAALWAARPAPSRLALGATLYLGLVATILAYAIWGSLLRRYPAALVTPFALLVPFVAAGASWLVFGERFGGRRLLGAALVLLGLTVIVGRPRIPGAMAPGRPEVP